MAQSWLRRDGMVGIVACELMPASLASLGLQISQPQLVTILKNDVISFQNIHLHYAHFCAGILVFLMFVM